MPVEYGNTLPFETGDDSSGGSIVYRLVFIPQTWMLQAIMAALNLMTTPANWNTVGLISPDEAAQLSCTMVEAFNPMFPTIGMIFAYTGPGTPAQTLECDGSSYLRTDYPDLFAVIGCTFGCVDSDHFTVPDLRYRVPVGVGPYSGQPDIAIGDTGGEPEHTLTQAEMPSHSHSYGGTLLTSTTTPPPLDGLSPNPFPAATGNTGGDGAHNNMQPYLGVKYVISTV